MKASLGSGKEHYEGELVKKDKDFEDLYKKYAFEKEEAIKSSERKNKEFEKLDAEIYE
jgi:hypothetical protein